EPWGADGSGSPRQRPSPPDASRAITAGTSSTRSISGTRTRQECRSQLRPERSPDRGGAASPHPAHSAAWPRSCRRSRGFLRIAKFRPPSTGLEPDSSLASAKRVDLDVAVRSTRMAACEVCRVENPEGAKFCVECGAQLAATAPERFRRTVTILFSDIVGSTALGERLDPETFSRVMGEYFAAVKPAVERHGGTLAKFIGDAVMAVFGLTRLHEDDALRAVRAAVEMQRALAELNRELERRYGLMLSARTGINTGPVAG